MKTDMKFVTDLNKGVLGEPDSAEMWEEIINHIPNSELLKPDYKVLIVGSGHCTEAIVIVKRMINLGIDKDKINNSIYLIDKYEIFTSYAKSKYGFKNVIKCDFLTWDTTLKFDNIVGNPPYKNSNKSEHVRPGGGSGNIYQIIVKKSFSLLKPNGYLAMVVPTSMFGGTQFGKVSRDLKTAKIENNITHVKTNIETYFNVGTKICYFISRNCDLSDEYINVNGDKFNFAKYKFIPTYTNPLALSILEKLTSGSVNFSFKRDNVIPNPCVVMHQMQGAGVTNTGKVKFHNDRYGDVSGMLYHNCTDVLQFEKSMHSNIVRFFIKMIKINNTLYFGMLNAMDIHPLEGMTNAELYKHFKLTQIEIDFLEDNVK